MSTLAFTKGHGTENDFVMLFDERGDVDLTPELVRFLCDRRAGLGADGVIRAVRCGASGDDAVAGEPSDRWFMDYWNSDGSTSEMCGNGARVFGALLERDAGEDLTDGLTFATRGGERTVTALGSGRYRIGMGPWVLPGGGAADAAVSAPGMERQPAEAWSVDVGNPHAVAAVADDAALAALDLTHPPAVTPPPANGVNVEFVAPVHAAAEHAGEDGPHGEPRGLIAMRVHERGSGETRSCGTGACAAAIVARAWAGEGAPAVWDVAVPGGLVTVRITPDEVTLEGPAVLVADGEVRVP